MRRTRWIRLAALVVVLASCTNGSQPSKSASLGHGGLIQTGEGASYEPKGKLVADLGFRPEKNGFSFENYGEGPYQNITAEDLRGLFGDRVCGYLDGDTCDLTPEAAQWMEQTNEAMSGGHCYGFSVASLLFFARQLVSTDYGASSVPAITLTGNESIQRTIATAWAFQALPDIASAAVHGTPNEILDKLIEALQSRKELYTVGIYQADGTGGHAITPFAVEDRGDGTFAVLVYDNNYPDITRAILFDRKANEWGYSASTNPDEPAADYIGTADSDSIALYPTTPAFADTLACPFCTGSTTGYHSLGANKLLGTSQDDYNIVILTGDPRNHAHVLLTDKSDRVTGWQDGHYVNKIPGVVAYKPFMDLWDEAVEPIYYVPTSVDFDVTIDGTELTAADKTSVSMIGPGYEVAVEDINVQPGETDRMALTPDGKTLVYYADSTEAPFIDVGIEGAKADYEFAVQGVDLVKGAYVTVSLDTEKEVLVLVTEGSAGPGTYALGIRRVDDTGEKIFSNDSVTLQPSESAGIVFGDWANDGQGVPMIVSTKSGDKTITLKDEGNDVTG